MKATRQIPSSAMAKAVSAGNELIHARRSALGVMRKQISAYHRNARGKLGVYQKRGGGVRKTYREGRQIQGGKTNTGGEVRRGGAGGHSGLARPPGGAWQPGDGGFRSEVRTRDRAIGPPSPHPAPVLGRGAGRNLAAKRAKVSPRI